jgi:hypothetical protein
MFMPMFRIICVLVALTGVLVYRADTVLAQGSDAERQACTPDAMRLCGDAIPDVAKVTACMKAKSSQLSEPCRAAMGIGGKGGVHHYRHRHCRHC